MWIKYFSVHTAFPTWAPFKIICLYAAWEAVKKTPEHKIWDEADTAYDVAKYAWEKVEEELNNEKNTNAL